MDLTESKKKIIATTVYDYIFLNIWNEPKSEFRNNVKLLPLSKQYYKKYFYNKTSNIKLIDDNNFYYVFGCNDTNLSSLIKTHEQWINSVTICNDYKITVDIYDNTGKMHPKSDIFIKTSC